MSSLSSLVKRTVSNVLRNVINENMTNKVSPLDKIKSIVERNGGIVYSMNYDRDSAIHVIVNKSISGENLRNIEKAFRIAGWSCINHGDYDKDMHMSFAIRDAKHSIESLAGVPVKDLYALKFEPDHGTQMSDESLKFKATTDDGFDTNMDIYDGIDIYSNKYNRNKYKKGIFYHVTMKKFLPRIMKYGLVPKNGKSLTNITRKSNDRVYLLLVKPKDNSYEKYLKHAGNNGEETVILKVNLNKSNNDIKIYDDPIFPYAVYVTENIPPYCLSVVDGEEPPTYDDFLKNDADTDLAFVTDNPVKRKAREYIKTGKIDGIDIDDYMSQI